MILSKGIVGNPLKAPEKTLENIPTLIDRAIFPGTQGGPHMNNIAAKAVAFGEALKPEFKVYAKQVVDNASALAEAMIAEGFYLVAGGTSNHLILSDVVKSFHIDGKVAETALDAIGLTLNKNSVPNDTNPPFRPSGIRLGTPALTTRGMKEEHMPQIARWMRQAIDARDDETELAKIHEAVKSMLRDYPVPQ
jgi:glycine hydroxymethyltransferase